MRWTLLLLVLPLAGCSTAGDASPDASTEGGPGPEEDVCAAPWAVGVDEAERHQFNDGVRLVLVVRDVDRERALADVRYDIVWGRDAGDARRLDGTLDGLVGAPPLWTYEDATGPGTMSDGDRFVLDAPGAQRGDVHAMVTLRDAEGRFLGGSPRCL